MQINQFWISYGYYEKKRRIVRRYFASLAINMAWLSDLRRRMIHHFAHDTEVFKIFPRRKKNGTLVAKRNSRSTKSRLCNFLVCWLLRIFHLLRFLASSSSEKKPGCVSSRILEPAKLPFYLPLQRQVTGQLYPFHRPGASREWLSTPREIISMDYVRKSFVIFSTWSKRQKLPRIRDRIINLLFYRNYTRLVSRTILRRQLSVVDAEISTGGR